METKTSDAPAISGNCVVVPLKSWRKINTMLEEQSNIIVNLTQRVTTLQAQMLTNQESNLQIISELQSQIKKIAGIVKEGL